MVPKECADCIHHEAIAFQVERLTMRMDRIEKVGVSTTIAVLIAIIAQLWITLDLPAQLRADRQQELKEIVSELKAK